MLGRHNFDRLIDFSPSPCPLISPSSQISASSQAESRVPATPKHVYHDRSFDQNVPSTPFTNLSMPNRTAACLRETDVSHFTPPSLTTSENVSSFSRTGDQLVPLTPEDYRQNTNTSISSRQSQDSVSSNSFQSTNSYNSIKKPSPLKNRSKLSIKKNIQESYGKADFNTTAPKQLDSSSLNSSPLLSSTTLAISTDQFEMNEFKEESTHIFLSNNNSMPGLSSAHSKTPTVINRAEVTNIRRSLFNEQSSPSFNDLEINIDNLFTGDDIFL